jgi:type IV secretory pathway TrbF-like protein
MMDFKRRIAGALGAGILMIGVPTSALAYQPPVVPVVQQEGQGTYENMIAALGNLDAEVEQLNAITEMSVTNVRIFDADYLSSGQDPAALDQAVAMHDAEIQNVQSTLANHEIVRTVLEAVNIPVESVVAVDTLDGGDVAIYYQPS